PAPTPPSLSHQTAAPRRPLHASPTRRSSDLRREAASIGPPMRILLLLAMPDTASSLDRVMKFPNLGLCSLAARRSRFFGDFPALDRKSTRLNSSHVAISYAVFCLKKKINSIV